jgi:hypothetical protein
LLVKRFFFLLNSAFAMAILDLISQVHLPSSVNKLPKYSFMCYVILTETATLTISIVKESQFVGKKSERFEAVSGIGIMYVGSISGWLCT